MIFNIDTAFSLSLCDVADSPQKYNSPVIIIDRNLKVVGKNKKAALLFSNLRKGRNIGAYMWDDEAEKVHSLQNRQTVFVTMKNGETLYGATAVGFSDWILLLVRPMWADIHHRLERIYHRASGYDTRIPAEYTESESLMGVFLEKYCSVQDVSFFNICTMVDAVVARLATVNKTAFRRIELSSLIKECWSFGSEYDFSAILAYALFVCLDYADGDICVTLSESDDCAVITIKGDSKKTEEETEDLVKKFASGGLHWMAPVKMLVDGNLWDLSLEIVDEVGIKLNFVLPLAESKQPFALLDSHREFILRILRGFFA